MINAYSFLLDVSQQNSIAAGTLSNKCVFFKTYCVEVLLGRGYKYDEEAMWSRRVDTMNDDAIFMPANVSRNHWVLVIVRPV